MVRDPASPTLRCPVMTLLVHKMLTDAPSLTSNELYRHKDGVRTATMEEPAMVCGGWAVMVDLLEFRRGDRLEVHDTPAHTLLPNRIVDLANHRVRTCLARRSYVTVRGSSVIRHRAACLLACVVAAGWLLEGMTTFLGRQGGLANLG